MKTLNVFHWFSGDSETSLFWQKHIGRGGGPPPPNLLSGTLTFIDTDPYNKIVIRVVV